MVKRHFGERSDDGSEIARWEMKRRCASATVLRDVMRGISLQEFVPRLEPFLRRVCIHRDMEDETQATLMSSDDLQTSENSSVEEFDSKNYEGMQLQLLGASFKSREDLISSTKDVYLVQGYAISIKCSRKGKYVVLGCDRGGHYRNKLNIAAEDRKRKSGSRLINCPFQLRGKKQLDGFWKLKMENNLHNHEPSSDMSGHPLCRQLSEEQTAVIERMTRAGVQTRQILSALRQENANTKAVSRTIANMKFKIKKEKLAGRTPIQALFDELGRGNFIFDVAHHDNGKIKRLFFAHPITITLTRSFPTVFVMDCTYKTNRYKMPLLDIVGMSSFNTSYYSCFAFLESEKCDDYTWALEKFKDILEPGCEPSVIVTDRELALMNAIKIVFPRSINFLCVWHIEKNILAKCKSYFDKQQEWELFLSEWNAVIYSQTEEEYIKTWSDFEVAYKEKEDATKYIKNTWLPHKERFIHAWTEKYTHFRSHVSSRAEGAHAKLKQYLQVSTGDFQKVKERICLAIENDFQEIKSRLSSEKIRTLHDCNILLFKELNTRVSHFAMKELFKQWELVRSGKMSSMCTGQFKTVMGLPCAHMLNGWKENAIPIDAIHSQWRIDNRQFILPGDKIDSKAEKLKGLLDTFEEKYQEWPLTQKDKALDVISQLVNEHSSKFSEPEIVSHKGRPQGSMNKRNSSSTKRNLSEFEFVEKTRKCSVCGCVGHNSRSCRGKNTMSEYMDCYTPCPIEEENIVSDSYNLSEDFSRNPYFTNEERPGFFDL